MYDDDPRLLIFMCCAALFGVIVLFVGHVWLNFPLSDARVSNLVKTESQCVLTALKANTSPFLTLGDVRNAQSDCIDAQKIDERKKHLTPE